MRGGCSPLAGRGGSRPGLKDSVLGPGCRNPKLWFKSLCRSATRLLHQQTLATTQPRTLTFSPPQSWHPWLQLSEFFLIPGCARKQTSAQSEDMTWGLCTCPAHTLPPATQLHRAPGSRDGCSPEPDDSGLGRSSWHRRKPESQRCGNSRAGFYQDMTSRTATQVAPGKALPPPPLNASALPTQAGGPMTQPPSPRAQYSVLASVHPNLTTRPH